MSTYPPPNQPYYPNYAPAGGSRRPTAVTVFAIIGIVFGIYGVLCKPAGIAMLFLPALMAQNQAMNVQRDDPVIFGWGIASNGIGFFISILLLSASIACLSLKPWARRGMIYYGIAAIVMNVVQLVVNMVWVMPKVMAAQEEMMQQQGGAAPPAGMFAGIGIAGSVIGFIVAMIFPSLLLYFVRRPEVVGAFEGTGPGGAGQGGYPGGGFPPNTFQQQQPGGYYAGQPSQQAPQPQPPGPYTPPQG